jgi:putative glutathione S-transferase
MPGDRMSILGLHVQIYDDVANGVYKSGFATSQAAYNAAQSALFSTLDMLESQLSDGRRFLLGDKLTEADVRLLPALARFDAVYTTLFKCTRYDA